MAKSSLDLESIPSALLDFFNRRVDLRWVHNSKVKQPHWFTSFKARPVSQYAADDLYRLLKAKQEGLVTLALNYDADKLWQSQHDVLNEWGIDHEDLCKAHWPAIETHCRRTLLNRAKLAAEPELILSALAEFKSLLIPPIQFDDNLLVIEPGLKTGLKLAACDPQGSILCHSIVFPHEPQNQWAQSIRKIDNFVSSNRIKALVIATGEGYRESRRFIKHWLNNRDSRLPCYTVRGLGLSKLTAPVEYDSTDSLYLKVDAIANLTINPIQCFSRLSLKSLLTNPLLSIVNQSRLSQALSSEWNQLAEKLATERLQEDPLINSSITDFDDLKVGLKLSGKVVNQTDYGFFIDVGIQENGLLHNSKVGTDNIPVTGQLVDVTVISFSHEKKQYSLAMKSSKPQPKKPTKTKKSRAAGNSAMADALKAAMIKKH